MRSLEGIDIVWIEEAANISANSYEVLIPTICRPGSEIWVSYNPDLETDSTHQRFAINPPPDALVEIVNYIDNPWFPPTLDAERRYLERVDPDAAAHVWGGECRSQTDAQVFKGKCAIETFEPQKGMGRPLSGSRLGLRGGPDDTGAVLDRRPKALRRA